MPNYLGVDLGGTKTAYVLSDSDGHFLFEKTFTSPYCRTSRQLPSGEHEVFLDTILDDIPPGRRVSHYMMKTETDFLNEAKNRGLNGRYEKKGYSLCGKTWEQDGKIFMMGSNVPSRFTVAAGDRRNGVFLGESAGHIRAANDGNAAATAQGIYYRATRGIAPKETGYFILGTGFGFGVPEYFALTEIGHIPAGFIPELLWQDCGCTGGHRTACVENYASGRGIRATAELLLSIGDKSRLRAVSECLPFFNGHAGLADLIAGTKLEPGSIDSKTVMDNAHHGADGFCAFIADLAAEATAHAAVTSAQLFGLQVIGIGESIARHNPWHVENIAGKVDSYLEGNAILTPPLKVEMTPLKEPAKYGALSLIVPEEKYAAWADIMKNP
jgi:predicted NBD/HSP70 family sugar kinase